MIVAQVDSQQILLKFLYLYIFKLLTFKIFFTLNMFNETISFIFNVGETKLKFCKLNPSTRQENQLGNLNFSLTSPYFILSSKSWLIPTLPLHY